MFDILIPIVGIALATGIIWWIVTHSPLVEPFKSWLAWAVIAIGLIWCLKLVLPIFGVNL